MEYRFSSISSPGVLYGAALIAGRSLKEGGTYIEYGSHDFLLCDPRYGWHHAALRR